MSKPIIFITILMPFAASAAQAKAARCLTEKNLNQLLMSSVQSVDFDQVVDLGPAFTEDPCPASEPACKHGRAPVGKERFPQIDLAVIAFQPECKNNVVGSNVFFSRSFPSGLSAQFDKLSGEVSNIRLQRWTQERFDEGVIKKGTPVFDIKPGRWKQPFPPEDLLNADANKTNADFMSPYPASIFKLLVEISVLQVLEEQGPLEQQLDGKYTYDFGTPDPKDDVTLTFRQFLQAMIQWSGNKASAAMIQFLHKRGKIIESDIKDAAGYPAAAAKFNRLNELFANLGLGTLQMNRTRSKDGLWGNRDTMYLKESSSISHISMPSWDTARLLWIMRTLKSTPVNQRPAWMLSKNLKVNPFLISDEVKQFFWADLKNQFFHEVLSNSLHCQQNLGGVFGIPALMAETWLSPEGLLKLPANGFPFPFAADELKGDYTFSGKIAECQKSAEVEFASKTGLTSVSGSQAGLVKGLSERGFKREYIVVLNSSLGSRFTDLDRLDGDRVIPCFDKTMCYTKRINQLGANIDNSLKGWLEAHDNTASAKSRNLGKTKGK